MQYLLTEEEYKAHVPDRARIEKEIRAQYREKYVKSLLLFTKNILHNSDIFHQFSPNALKIQFIRKAAEESFEVTLSPSAELVTIPCDADRTDSKR